MWYEVRPEDATIVGRRRYGPTVRSAFSLAEVVVALVIAGILFALALPRLAAIQDAAATRGAAADLDALFATARHLAVTRRENLTVRLDPVSAEAQVRGRGQILVRHRLGAIFGISMTATRDSSVYDARGLGYGAANFTVVLRRRRAIDSVVVSRLGRVRSAW